MAKKRTEKTEPDKPDPLSQFSEALASGAEGAEITGLSPDADLKPGTLSGDLRDALLTHMRSITVPWAMLGEQEQRDKIFAVESMARHLVRRTISVIGATRFPSVNVTIGDWKVGRTPEVKCGFLADEENCVTLVRSGNHGLLVFASAEDYFGERAPAKADKDQPDLPLDQGPSAPAEPG